MATSDNVPPPNAARAALTVALTYAIAGTLWIIASDVAVDGIFDTDTGLAVQTAKGIGFVAVTSGVVYLALRRLFGRLDRASAEQRALLRQIDQRARERQYLLHRLLRAEEDTRRTVAQDIHDGPLQGLTLSFMQLDTVRGAGALPEGSDADDRVSDAMEAIRGAAGDLRAIVSSLQPPLLADLGLAVALKRYCDDLGQATGRDVRVEVDGPTPALEGDVSIALFRIAQEAIANAMKHTAHGAVRVRLSAEANGTSVEVMDSGPGFDVDAASGGLGLVGMRERAEAVGGTFTLATSHSAGTWVRISVPLSGSVRSLRS